MYRVTAETRAVDGTLDLALDRPAGWFDPPYPMGRLKFAAALFGDAEAGPFAALYSDGPRTEPMVTSPGHGHGSDSWRISLQGTLRMGAQRYEAGRFRFQQGRRTYGADDVSWGPDGGYSVVMMADRRGAGARAADPAEQWKFDQNGAGFSAWVGANVTGPFEAPQGLAVTLGPVRAGHVEGSFEQQWPEIVPGIGFVAGLLGDRTAGPMVLLTKAGAGDVALPALEIESDIMHIVARGTARQGDTPLLPFGIRLTDAATRSEPVTAGPDGLWLATVIGDRRAVAAARTGETGSTWLAQVKQTAASLAGALA
jgi:hypothetical protein